MLCDGINLNTILRDNSLYASKKEWFEVWAKIAYFKGPAGNSPMEGFEGSGYLGIKQKPTTRNQSCRYFSKTKIGFIHESPFILTCVWRHFCIPTPKRATTGEKEVSFRSTPPPHPVIVTNDSFSFGIPGRLKIDESWW